MRNIEFSGIAATEAPVAGKILLMDGLKREPGPIPLLLGHENRTVGWVTRTLVRPGALHVRGHVEDDGSPAVRRLVEAMRAGQRGLSIAFDILDSGRHHTGVQTVTAWRLREVSVVRSPADRNCTLHVETPLAPAVIARDVAPARVEHRAYSLLTIKRASDDARTITGIATSPEADRMGDIVEPKGAVFKLPLPLLWQHRSTEPIGHVTAARVTSEGIEVEAKLTRIAEPGALKDRLDGAWQSIRSGLVRGLSIGFRSIGRPEFLDGGGLRFLNWEWLELSAVTIPANAEASITAVKAAAAGMPVAPRRRRRGFDPVLFGHQLGEEMAKVIRPLQERIEALERDRGR